MMIYSLYPDHDFKTIGPVERLTLGRMFDGNSLAQTWKSIEMKLFDEGKKKLKKGDFPGHPIAPFFSQKAVDALKDILEPAGELLPTSCGNETYYAYNVLNVVDAVDLDRSEVMRTPNGKVFRTQAGVRSCKTTFHVALQDRDPRIPARGPELLPQMLGYASLTQPTKQPLFIWGSPDLRGCIHYFPRRFIANFPVARKIQAFSALHPFASQPKRPEPWHNAPFMNAT